MVNLFTLFQFFLILFFLKVTNKLHYVDYARGTNVNFTDSGLFGLRLSGSAENVKLIDNLIILS
jgi:hypothetical protein